MKMALHSGLLRRLVALCIIIMIAPPVRADTGRPVETPPEVFANSLGMAFRYIPPGTFSMGTPPEERGRDLDETQHPVTLTHGFYLQETEVTQAQWEGVMGFNPSMMKDPACPVTNISRGDALAFIQRLNRLDGTNAYRLPTEAEWEWACRAGSSAVFPVGPLLSTDQANYDGNHPYDGYEKGIFRRGIVKAGNFPPNPWGLYDMSGNVWEWCQDDYNPYPSTAQIDPVGPRSACFGVVRGGSWYYDIQGCRCACRHKSDPSKQSMLIGFRVAKSLQ